MKMKKKKPLNKRSNRVFLILVIILTYRPCICFEAKKIVLLCHT